MPIDIDNQGLPHGWIKINLEEAGSWCSGGTPSRKRHEFFGKGIYWIKSGDLTDGLITQVEEQITQEGLENSSAKLLPVDTISIALYGATIGKLGILTFPAATNQACANVVPNKNLVTVRYLFYYLASQKQNLIDKGKGGAQPNISQEILKAHPLLLAPLNEQRRIVAKLEKLLSKVDTCKERLDKIPGILKRFRQSVLSAACSGRLTADWRENNPDYNWESTTLETLIKGKPRNGYSPKPVNYSTKVKSLTLTAVTSGKFKPEHFKYIDEEIDAESHLWLAPGDILIQRSNTIEYVGSSAIYTQNFGEFIYPDLMMKIQVKKEKAKSEFIHYALSSENTRRYFRENATGTAGNMPKINQQIAMNTPIDLPSLAEQQEIVCRVETLFKTADQIEQRYQKAKSYIDQLTQSILAKAFRGELVPQDPNDEPASVLLERIRTERENKADIAKTAKKPAANKKQSSKKAQPQLEPTPQLEPIQLELPLFD